MKTISIAVLRNALAMLLTSLVLGQTLAAPTAISNNPLATSSATQVKPNIFYVLDDSGSMGWGYLPDWAGVDYSANISRNGNGFGNGNGNGNISSGPLYQNNGYNGVAYNPATTYTPPVTYANVSYYSMTSTNTNGWTQVPVDAFGVQSNTTANLVGNASYYTFIAGEYCKDQHLTTCKAQTAPSTAYPYPAYLRWCTTVALTTCQATFVNTGVTTYYSFARYPGYSAGGISVPGSNVLVNIVSTNNSYPYPGTSPAAKAGTRSDCAGTTCTYAEEMTNYANWYAYYQTRMQMVKTAATLAFTAVTTNYRIGYMSINNNTKTDFLNINDVTLGSGGQLDNWYKKFLAANPGNSTTTRTALSKAGQYYAGKLYNTTLNGSKANDPMQYACQRNYTILSTDGYWNEGNTASTATNTAVSGITDLSGNNLGDQDSPTAIAASGSIAAVAATPLPYSEGAVPTYNTMADVAAYYYNTDIRSPTFGNANNGATGTDVASNNVGDGKQRMFTSTMGLGASGFMQYQAGYATAKSGDYYDVSVGNTASTSATTATASLNKCTWQASGTICSWPVPVSNQQTTIDDLWHTAVNGRGTYYSAQNPVDVKNSLSSFLSSVAASLGSSAAATVSSPNLTSGNNTQFHATFVSQQWYGELSQYTINATSGAISSTPNWSESGTGSTSTGTSTTPTIPALLDNQAGVPGTSYSPSNTARSIYTYDIGASTSALTTFTWGNLSSAAQSYFTTPAISGLSQFTIGSGSVLPTAAQVNSTSWGTSSGAGGFNLVAYLSGDRSNEVNASPAGGAYYRQRAHVLGDIVNSQPNYVPGPQYSYSDAGYSAFVTAQANRQAMLYVGANDGMLHAFNGSNGNEAWAYIPSMVLPNLYKLADMNYANQHSFYVDGSPQTGDVCFSNCGNGSADWHTILVGGLGAGGRGYYALDVSNPASPTLLWEFTFDTSKSGLGKYITDADLGLSFGTPIITKLSDGTWVVLVSSGYNNISPGTGNGIVWVLNAQTGAIIKKINTGNGTTTTPSGLAQISAYASNGATDNTSLRIYGGDLTGKLWRMDISTLTATGGSAVTQLLSNVADSAGTAQPITAPPQTGTSGGTPLVLIGTGQFLALSDLSTTQTQTIYSFKESLTTTAAPLTTPVYTNPHTNTCASSAATNCFVKNTLVDSLVAGSNVRNATSTVTINLPTMNGWYADLPESSERMTNAMALQLGLLVFTSNIPGSSSVCSAGGSAYTNYVDFATGLALQGQSNTGVLLSYGGGTALGNAPTLFETTNGTVIIDTTLSNGGNVTQSLTLGGGTTPLRRTSWRELIGN